VALIPPGISPVAPSTAGLKFVTETLITSCLYCCIICVKKSCVSRKSGRNNIFSNTICCRTNIDNKILLNSSRSWIAVVLVIPFGKLAMFNKVKLIYCNLSTEVIVLSKLDTKLSML
jgi:hypothetical protein